MEGGKEKTGTKKKDTSKKLHQYKRKALQKNGSAKGVRIHFGKKPGGSFGSTSKKLLPNLKEKKKGGQRGKSLRLLN